MCFRAVAGTLCLSAAALIFGCATVGGRTTYDVRDFGAKGDGIAKDTAAIQSAIDAASAAGGGTVELPAGTYLSGSIWLRSNIDFHLCAGAVLKGSGDIADYCAADCCPQNAASPKSGDNTTGGHLILCVGQRNVTVRGPGRVDGNSAAFLLNEDGKLWKGPDYARMVRPAQMVWFVDSTDIRITDLELANAPYWSCFLLNCDRVWVRGCYIHTERIKFHTYNGDGLDLDRCRWVTVSDCRIDTADDCITLRASGAKRLAEPHDCANVTIANCNLSSSCNGIRFGVGEGRIHDVTVTGLTITETPTAINFVAAYSPKTRGTDITDVRISECVIRAQRFLDMCHGHAKEALFANLVFTGISGTTEEASKFAASDPALFRNIVFRDVEVGRGYVARNAAVTVERGDFKEEK